MKTQREIEDIIQESICRMLPKFNRTKIRPAYQNDADEGFNFYTEDDTHTIAPFGCEDNFIYFQTVFNTSENQTTYIAQDGATDITRYIDVTIDIYGEDCQSYGLIISSLIKSEYIQVYLNSQGLYLVGDEVTSTHLHEIIQNEWWQRQNIKITLSENVKIELADDFMVDIAKAAPYEVYNDTKR